MGEKVTTCRVLVTGGAGFLGKYVTKLLEQNRAIDAVIPADNLDKLCGGTTSGELEYLDVCDYEELTKEIRRLTVTHIVHLAAYGRNLTCQNHPRRAFGVNVTGTLNVLEAARSMNLKRVVCCSSNIVLSDKPTVYKTTKQACEQLVELYSSMGVSCMGLRPSNIYGKDQSKSEYQLCAFAGLDRSYAEHGNFTISGDGTQTRDWVHAEDVARAFEWALLSDTVGKTLDVCTGEQTSMNGIASLLGVPVKYGPARPGDAKQLESNPNELGRMGFETKIHLAQRVRDAFPSVP